MLCCACCRAQQLPAGTTLSKSLLNPPCTSESIIRATSPSPVATASPQYAMPRVCDCNKSCCYQLFCYSWGSGLSCCRVLCSCMLAVAKPCKASKTCLETVRASNAFGMGASRCNAVMHGRLLLRTKLSDQLGCKTRRLSSRTCMGRRLRCLVVAACNSCCASDL